jgi:hypothetical protein
MLEAGLKWEHFFHKFAFSLNNQPNIPLVCFSEICCGELLGAEHTSSLQVGMVKAGVMQYLMMVTVIML